MTRPSKEDPYSPALREEYRNFHNACADISIEADDRKEKCYELYLKELVSSQATDLSRVVQAVICHDAEMNRCLWLAHKGSTLDSRKGWRDAAEHRHRMSSSGAYLVECFVRWLATESSKEEKP